jgi:hypothetical protein
MSAKQLPRDLSIDKEAPEGPLQGVFQDPFFQAEQLS